MLGLRVFLYGATASAASLLLLALGYYEIRLTSEVSGILELGNVWVFVQLIFGPHWPMNQLNKNPNIA